MPRSVSSNHPRAKIIQSLRGTGKFPVPLLFAALALVCVVVGCSGGDNADNGIAPQPPAVAEKPPVNWDDQSDRDWLHRSQFKTNMRHMWIDSNRVASAGRGDMEPSWAEIRAGAGDIRTRASLIGGFWAKIQQHAEEALLCADDEDRIGVTNELVGLNEACDGCHMLSWSPAYLHVTEGVVDGWLAGKDTDHTANKVEQLPPPEIPNRQAMKDLWFHTQMAELRLKNWEVEDLQAELKAILPEAKVRAERWKTVTDNAGKLVDLARARKREGMKDAYIEMTSTCLACHTQLVGGREILIPMPWDKPVTK